jgi:adenine-specific DNA-methyltransferase
VLASQAAVDGLVLRVAAAAGTAADTARLRAVFARVLNELEVAPGDPAWTDGRDVVGAAYERLVSGRVRRGLGQFFTPLPIGRAMAHWLLADRPRLVLDPGCGSGSLLAAADHERTAPTRLLGLDVDQLAIAMAKKNADLRAIAGLELRRMNFLTDEIAERPEAIICNPPYTRHQALTAPEKEAIHESLSESLGIRFSQLASLPVLFLVRALAVAADQARLAFITPTHWLDMNYAEHVKELVLEMAHVEAIVELPATELVFEHAITTATITLIRKGGDGTAPTRMLRAKSTRRDDIIALLQDSGARTAVRLSTGKKWSRPPRRASRKGLRLDEVAHVRRGAATGCNSFFVLSDEERRLRGLSRCSLRPCIASPRLLNSDELNDATLAALPDTAPRWLLAPTHERRDGPLARYLLRANELGVHERHLVKQRVAAGRPWWRVEAKFEAPILFSYFNRQRPRFVRNRVQAVPLNNWLVIQPHEDIDADSLFAALSEPAIVGRLTRDARRYGNGLWKLEPSELKQLHLGLDRDGLTTASALVSTPLATIRLERRARLASGTVAR